MAAFSDLGYSVRVSRLHNVSFRLPIAIPQHKADLPVDPGPLLGIAGRNVEKRVVKSTGGLVVFSDSDMDCSACIVGKEKRWHICRSLAESPSREPENK